MSDNYQRRDYLAEMDEIDRETELEERKLECAERFIQYLETRIQQQQAQTTESGTDSKLASLHQQVFGTEPRADVPDYTTDPVAYAQKLNAIAAKCQQQASELEKLTAHNAHATEELAQLELQFEQLKLELAAKQPKEPLGRTRSHSRKKQEQPVAGPSIQNDGGEQSAEVSTTTPKVQKKARVRRNRKMD